MVNRGRRFPIDTPGKIPYAPPWRKGPVACAGRSLMGLGRIRKRDECLLVVLDGLSDRSQEGFGHRTPQLVARTPFLDQVASLGANGLLS